VHTGDRQHQPSSETIVVVVSAVMATLAVRSRGEGRYHISCFHLHYCYNAGCLLVPGMCGLQIWDRAPIARRGDRLAWTGGFEHK